jgi:hypothetical protein
MAGRTQILRLTDIEVADGQMLTFGTPTEGYQWVYGDILSYLYTASFSWPGAYDVHALWIYPTTVPTKNRAGGLHVQFTDPEGKILSTSGYRADFAPLAAEFAKGQWLPVDWRVRVGERWKYQLVSEFQTPGRIPVLALVTRRSD